MFRDIGPSHRSRLELHDEDDTKQLRVEITHLTFGEVDEQNLVVIHNLGEVKSALGLANNIAHRIVADEWAKLRDHPANQITSFIRALRGWELFSPKVEHLPIRHVFELSIAELLIHQQLWHINKRSTRRISHQQQRTVTEDVLEAWPNDTGVTWVVQAIQHVDRLLHQEVLLVGVIELKHIETNRVAHIARVEVDNILYPITRYFSKQCLSQVTVRINQGKTPPRQHILVGQVLLQDRLTYTRLTNDMDVTPTVFICQANRLAHAAELIVAKQQPRLHHLCWAIDLLAHLALDLRGRNAILVWQMEEGCKLHRVENIAIICLWEKSEDKGRRQFIDVLSKIKLKAIKARRIKQCKRRYDILEQHL